MLNGITLAFSCVPPGTCCIGFLGQDAFSRPQIGAALGDGDPASATAGSLAGRRRYIHPLRLHQARLGIQRQRRLRMSYWFPADAKSQTVVPSSKR